MAFHLFPGLPPEKAKARTIIICSAAGAVLLAAAVAAVILLIPKSGPAGTPSGSAPAVSDGQSDSAAPAMGGDGSHTTAPEGSDGSGVTAPGGAGDSAVATPGGGRPGTNSHSGGGSGGAFTPVIRPQDGYVNIVDFGAVPSDNGDDTEAFRLAAKSGYGIFVPAGEYRLSGTVELNGQDIVGEAQAVAVIRGASDQTLFRLKGNCKLAELTVGYANGTAGRGKKTAVRIASDNGYALSPSVKNVRFTQVGTAVFIEKGKTNGVRLEDIAVDNFGYAGVVFDGSGSRNASLRGVYLNKALRGAGYGVELQGDEGTLLEQVTVENATLKQAIRFDRSVAFSVKTAQFISVKADAMVGGSQCGGRVGSLYLQGCTGKNTSFTNAVGGSIEPEYTASR